MLAAKGDTAMRAFAAAVLALSACATGRPRGEVVPEKELKVAWQNGYRGQGPKGPFTCRLETPTGSHQQMKVCRYDEDDADSARRRQQMQDTMNQNALTGTPLK
jgi:hypothetical protein